MKILYLITKSNFGGAQRYVFDLATHAKDAGHEVLVGAGGRGPLLEQLESAGVRTVSIDGLARDINPLLDGKSFVALLRLFEEERPDVIHLNSSKIGGLGALAGRVWNTSRHIRSITNNTHTPARIVFTGHGWAFNEDRSDATRALIGALHWLTIMLTHRSIAVSERTKSQIEKLPFVSHKLVVVRNGVGPIVAMSKEDALKVIFAEKEIPQSETPTLMVGTLAELHKNKGLTYALEGLALLKKQRPLDRVHFTVLGDGEERNALEAQIVRLGLEDSVHLAGYKEGGARLLSAFDVFLLPSITEAFPYAILEAGKMGLPVIATAVGGIPEIIDDMESGILIQSKNPGEVARALAYLIQEPDRKTALGKAIALRIKDRFNVRTMAEETIALYRDGDSDTGKTT